MSDRFHTTAFPAPSSVHGKPFNGLTKLEWFTGMALVGLLACGTGSRNAAWLTMESIEQAKDTLNKLEELQEKETE
jgi:hypothetical protein